ncbi:C-C motif chemokine 19 [Ciconia maguari]
MQWLHLLYLSLLVLGHILDVHGGNNVLDCCLWMSERPIPRQIVQDYWLQLVQDGCDIPAAMFIITKGKRLCDPLQAPWVVCLQEKLDASSARKCHQATCIKLSRRLLDWSLRPMGAWRLTSATFTAWLEAG